MKKTIIFFEKTITTVIAFSTVASLAFAPVAAIFEFYNLFFMTFIICLISCFAALLANEFRPMLSQYIDAFFKGCLFAAKISLFCVAILFLLYWITNNKIILNLGYISLSWLILFKIFSWIGKIFK